LNLLFIKLLFEHVNLLIQLAKILLNHACYLFILTIKFAYI